MPVFIYCLFVCAVLFPLNSAGAGQLHLPAAVFLPFSPPNLVGYEYWFDQAGSQRTYVAVGPSAELTLDLDLPAAGLSNGVHTLHLRFLDDAGQWSGIMSQTFVKLPPPPADAPQITAYRYWFDNDAAQAVQAPVGPAAELLVLTDLPTAGLSNGVHTLYLRFLDDAGQWSGIMSQTFVKLPPPPADAPQITAYHYWFDNNAAQAVEVPVAPAYEVSVLTDLPAAGLSNGVHTLHLRFLDDAGQWSGIMSQTFVKLPPPPAGSPQITAYHYWFDNNAAQAVQVAVGPAAEVSVLTDLPAAGLSNGVHTLHLRFLDDAGQWSGVLSQTFVKLPPPPAGSPQITAYHYWFDNNVAQAVEVPVAPASEVSVLTDLPAAGLPNGVHTLHLRFLDDAGQWSGVISQVFTKFGAANPDNKITAYRYWLDFNFTGATEVVLTTPVELLVLDEDIDFSALPEAPHVLHFQFKDLNGAWSVVTSDTFNLGLPPVASFVPHIAPCKNGEINFQNTSSFATSWLWQFGDGGVSAATAPNHIYAAPGTYTVTLTITDATTGFTATYSAPVAAQFLELQVQVNAEASSCFNSNDGAATASASNGAAPFNYIWSTGQSAAAVANFYPGTYTVTATASDGCTQTASFTIANGSNLTTNIAVIDQATCPAASNGVAQIQVQAGVPPYAYLWSNGETTQTAVQLPVGLIGATVTDAAGCSIPASEIMGYDSDLTATTTVLENPACRDSEDGSARIDPLGGLAPYTFLWSNGETTALAAQLPAGQSGATVTDANGCAVSGSVNLGAPPALTAAVSVTDAACFGSSDGSATLTPAGGTPPYGISWSTGATGALLNNVAAGSYQATVADDKGCQAVLPVTVQEPALLTLVVDVSGISCNAANDGTATATPSGGTPPYDILWNNNANGASLSDLTPGLYRATATDARGCIAVSNESQIHEPPALQVALQAIDAPCGHDGGITSIVNGGTPPYNYAWSNGVAAAHPQMLDAGIYTVVVTDANDCTASATATVQALNHAPYVTFTGNPGFETRFVDPSSGSPYQTFRFEARYFDADGDLPRAGYPRLYLDFEGDGQLNGSNDQILILTESDPADNDPTDGKDYYAIRTGLLSSHQYKTIVRAFDPAGCESATGPENGPYILKSADIFLFANDIEFSDPHPDPLETILVSATIHNESDFAAENFVCRLTNTYTGEVFDPVTVPYLAAKSTITVYWPIVTPPDPSWNPMKVEIDATNLITEPNELDNQAIRPFVNGDYNLPGTILVEAAVTPPTSYFVSQTTLTLSGTAVYDGMAFPLPDPGCAGALVTATVLETGQTITGFTDNTGNFVLNFPQPLLPADYHINGIVTDYTLDGAFTASFSVNLLPAPCLKPDLSCRLELDRHTLNAGESVQGYVQVSNTGGGASVATQLKILTPGASPDALFLAVPALQPGATAEIPLPAIGYLSTGFVFVQAQVDYSDANDECHEYNNLSTTFVDVSSAIADIVPVSWNVYNANLPLCNAHTFIYRIQNNGGAATGFFGVKLEVWSNGMLQYEDTQPVASISANSFTYHAFTYTFPSAGDYALILKCDEPDLIVESDEGNNVFTRNVTVYECPVGADLIFGNCQSFGVEPIDPQTPGNITLTAALKNAGNIPAAAPFSVQLRVVHEGPGAPFFTDYFLVLNDDLDPGESAPVLFTVPKPSEGSNTFTLTADADGLIGELLESNNTASDALDWNFSLGPTCCTACMFWQKPVTTPNLWFSVGVSNAGRYVASAVPVKFEVSGPGLNGWVNLGNAAATNLGRTCGCPAGVALPDPFSFPGVGTYTVRMTVDPDNLYPESDETDNVLTVQVSVRPDMRVLSQYIAPSELHPDIDEHIVYTVSYENTGFSNPADSMELKLLVDGFPLDSARVSGLLSGDHGSVQFPTSWASNLAGVHVARAVIDHDGEVTENNETNNAATRALVVGEAANFRFAAFSPDNYHPSTGQVLTVTALIENNGDLSGTGRYQLAYVNDSGDTIPVYNKVLTLAAGQQQTVYFDWLVADAETILVGKIVNSTPQEFRYDDNAAWTVLGGLELSVNTTPELCVPNTGTAGAVVSGGTPPYFYSWSNGQISPSLNGLNAGNYALTTTDSEGRYGVVYFSIEQVTKPNLTFSVTNASCDQSDGSITMTVNGVALPYAVEWNTGSTSNTLVGLTPALYTVSVTDALGCEAVEDVIVAFDPLLSGSSNFCVSGYPAVSPAQAAVNAGATQTISGRDFSPNGLARLIVAGEMATLADAVEIPVDWAGKFEYELPIPANAPQGQYRVTALDAVTGFSAPVKYFQVNNPSPPEQDNIIITNPIVSQTFDAHSSQTIEWEQRILQKTGYPYTGRFRQYRYWVDISKDGGPWVRMGVMEGWTETGKLLGSSFAYEVPVASVNYRVRIQDAFDPGIFAISEYFQSVLPDANASLVRMKWDWSYGDPEEYRNVTLHGVAADGAARVFLEVKSPNLAQVSVSLADPEFPGAFDPRLLGKVMTATETSQYSEEANAATLLTDAAVADNGKVIFWYVAPEDFARSNADAQLKERVIRATFQIEYLNATPETKTLDIRIVRPPLMMIHGLGGDKTAWDIFSQHLTEDTWTVAQAVEMNPTASFDFNAAVMVLNGNRAIPKKADEYYPCFPCVIDQMRQKGFAANRVDYLAHSMGGAVFRNVLTNFREAYYRDGASAGWQYKNYGKGYANKVITIGTPHQGSILADIIDRYVDDMPLVVEAGLDLYHFFNEKGFPFTFIEKAQSGYQATPAVSDLQVSGGKSFAPANVRAHLIGGDYFKGEHLSSPSLIDQNTLDFLENVENALDFVYYFYRAASILETDPVISSKVATISNDLNKAQKAVLFLEAMADLVNYAAFVWESDLIVHLQSQHSGLGRYDPTVTVVDRVVHSPPLDLLPAIKELASQEIINTTFDLLNTPVGSNKFGPIPATANLKTNIPPPAVAAKPANSPCAVSLLQRDTPKIRILSPVAPVVTYVDSSFSVQIAIADTAGMQWADVYFQGRAYTLPTNFIGTYQLDIAAGVNSLDSQEVVLLAYYTRNDSCIGVVEKVTVRALSSEPLLSFEAFPTAYHLFPGQTVLPGFKATFPNGNSGELYFSPSIAVQVADPAIVTHQTGSPRFMGEAPGATYAVLNYGGLQDTVYFVVMPELDDLPSLPPPVASFGFAETISCAGAEVQFENNSLYADSYWWEFGDGETSPDQHPVHLYQQPGYHQAFLTVTQSQTGLTARYSVAIEVELPPGCNKTISGNLYWMGDGFEGVSQAQVTLSGDVNGTSGPTSSSGFYTFDIPAGSSVTITPWKNINLLNGVDAADASAIQRHLVNILPISDFFRLVAADVNRSFSVSTLDALVIRQALLGNPAAISILNKTKSWRFVPADYAYPNPAGPFSFPVFPESRSISAAEDHVPFQDFYGVKVGDVVETVNAADPANKSVQQIEPLVWEVQDQWLESGKTLAAEFSAMPFDNMAAFQFALQFDPAVLRFERIEVLAPDLPLDSANNFGTYHAADGELRIVWSVAEGVTLTQIKPVFRLHFTVMRSGKRLSEVMRLAPEVLTPAAFSAVLAPGEVQLLFSENTVSAFAPTGSGLQLYQNRPNPFSEGTIIGFKLPEACDAQLRIVDAQGREVLQIARVFQAGYHEETIYMNEFGSGGIFYYELTTPVGRLVRKMTVIGR